MKFNFANVFHKTDSTKIQDLIKKPGEFETKITKSYKYESMSSHYTIYIFERTNRLYLRRAQYMLFS